MSAIPVVDVTGAERLYDAAAVHAAIERMGRDISAWLDGRDCLLLAVLQGGIVPTGLLLPQIEAPVQLDSVHVSRYRGATSGGELRWHAWPRTPVAGRRILLSDDILDEGHSLAGVRDWLRDQGAAEVSIAVLVEKRHARRNPDVRPDFVGLPVPDRYVFGFGMDVGGWHRNASGIYALAEG